MNEQFENIYWTKRKEVKAFYDAGGGDLITLGTDHPSWGEFFTPFSVHRELMSLSRSGIPNGAVLRDPQALMTSVEGKIGPMSAADTAAWAPTPRRGRGGNGAAR